MPESVIARPEPTRLRSIKQAAVSLFQRQGFEGTTMRQLAAEVGMEAPSLYNHFPSKTDLLAVILLDAMRSLVDLVRDGIDSASPDPASRLRGAIASYVSFHEDRLAEASISDTERRPLSNKDARRLLALRRELSDLFKDVITQGVKQGVFRVPDIGVANLAVLSVCARLPVWYRADGRLSLPQIADVLSDICLSALGARPPDTT